MTPVPLRFLVWLLTSVSSESAASAAVGDLLEELVEQRERGRAPRWPTLWLNARLLLAIAVAVPAAVPRFGRALSLTFRVAFRGVRSAPGHSAFVVLVLATGIALAAVTFSVVDAVLLKPLPIEEPDRVISIPVWDQDAQTTRITPSVYRRLKSELAMVEAVAPSRGFAGIPVTVGGVTDEWRIQEVSAEVFDILRFESGLGRLWTTADEARGDVFVAVLGYRFWQQQFGGDPSILGRSVSIGRRTFTIIGVLSAASDPPDLPSYTAPVWVPLVLPQTDVAGSPFGLLARMKPGVSEADVAKRVAEVAGAPDWRPEVRSLLDGAVSDVRRWMLLALGAAFLVVFIASANAANLMLTRAVGRTREMAIRASLGASRLQVACAVLAEGVILALGGTSVALLLSWGGVDLAKRAIVYAAPWIFRASTIALNERVLVASATCALFVGVIAALVPAWQASKTPVSALLQDADAPTATGRRRWRSIFLTMEVAMVAVLAVVSSMFVTSLVKALSINLGIDATNVVAVNPRVEFRTAVDDVRFRLKRIPGVVDVAVSMGASPPLFGSAFGGAWPTTKVGRPGAPVTGEYATALEIIRHQVTANYFDVTGLALVRGRALQPGDETAVLLDERVARQIFGDADPLGQQISSSSPAGTFTVVGLVPYVYTHGSDRPSPPAAYFLLRPERLSRNFGALIVKTSAPTSDVVIAATAALEPVSPAQKDPYIFAADEAVRRLTTTRRFLANLMSVFGVVGALIGVAGVYAVMGSFVAQQTREFGVRLALGATPGRIQRGVLRLTSRHLVAGLAIGLPFAWWISRGFEALLFQTTAADLSIYAMVVAMIGLSGSLAAWLPARRAGRVDPIVSLKR